MASSGLRAGLVAFIMVNLVVVTRANIKFDVTCNNVDFGEVLVYKSSRPAGGSNSGQFAKVHEDNLRSCIEACCSFNVDKCDTVFFHNGTCFHISCHSDLLCRAESTVDADFENSFVAQIHSVTRRNHLVENSSPERTVAGSSEAMKEPPDNGLVEPIYQRQEADKFDRRRKNFISPNSFKDQVCTVGMGDCKENEVCVSSNRRRKTGTCQCRDGYVREESGVCSLVQRPLNMSNSAHGGLVDATPSSLANPGVKDVSKVIRHEPSIDVLTVNPIPSEVVSSESSSSPPGKELVTTVVPFQALAISFRTNQTITLPANSTLIVAAVSPEPPPNETYKFEWSIVSHPSGEETGVMTDSNTATLRLTNLRQGLYTFNISVTGKNARGEATVNVTVLPPKRANRPPFAIVQPVNQSVQLPNKDTVLDGSSSTDDDRIVDYKWEPITLPIGFKSPFGLELNNTPTLQLKNLIPGFYQLKLTVIDSDRAENSTVANITVLKEKDYPPTANAGADVIINLPQNVVTLNGNQSTDDKNIVGWLWTRAPDDEKGKAVDMDGTTLPYLRLSKLEVGVYKFLLKVTDTANQTSNAEVHVFVKPEQFKGPQAVVDSPRTLNLPLESQIYLDGSKSTDDSPGGIIHWSWEQVEGPKPSIIDNSTLPRTLVTGLIPGKYVFRLTVVNGRGVNSTANSTITIVQNKNTPPIARAGGDKSVTLPVSVVTLNGSASWDDFAIVNYSWSRDSDSLAAGTVLEQSDSKPVLKLANLVAGKYLFKLTVVDKQGEKSSDVATLIVKSPSGLMSEVELVLDADIEGFTAEQESTTLKRLELLLNDGRGTQMKLVKVTLDAVPQTRRVHIVFVAELANDKLAPGPDVVRKLKDKLQSNMHLIEPGLLSLDTVVCQNQCSGHGVCDQTTKHCVCESFWMENLASKVFSDQESNCSWSVLYVVIIVFLVLVAATIAFWSLVYMATKKGNSTKTVSKPSRRRRRTRAPRINALNNFKHNYTLLDDRENDEDSDRADKKHLRLSNLEVCSTDAFELVTGHNHENGGLDLTLGTKRQNSRNDSSASSTDSEDVTLFDSTSARRSSKVKFTPKNRRSGSGSSSNGLARTNNVRA